MMGRLQVLAPLNLGLHVILLLLAVVARAHGQLDLAANLTSGQTRLRCSDIPADPAACAQFVAGCSDNYIVLVLCPVACGGCELAENTANPAENREHLPLAAQNKL